MKYSISLLLLASMAGASVVYAQEPAKSAVQVSAAAEDDSKALADLCNTYASEDGVSADKKASYIKECLNSMTDLSEAVQEPLPLVAEENNAPAAAPSSEQVNSDPEKLVKNELVETPDPNAEQLDAGKSH